MAWIDMDKAVSDPTFFKDFSALLNDRASAEDKPWIVFDVNVRNLIGVLAEGKWLMTMNDFCKEYNERMQNFCQGFVLVIQNSLVRFIAENMALAFPTELPLRYVENAEEAHKILRELRKE